MKNYSTTYAGVIIAVGGTLLVQFGFSESCSSEIISLSNAWLVPLLGGGFFALKGRHNKGDVSILGVRKNLG